MMHFNSKKLADVANTVNMLKIYQNGSNNNSYIHFNFTGLKPFDGFDFKIELAKLRGGTILWDIISHADFKVSFTV